MEYATKVNVEVILLREASDGQGMVTKGRKPHYKTIANFRKDNAKAFRQVFRNYVGVLKQWDLVDDERVSPKGEGPVDLQMSEPPSGWAGRAVDSFKIRAQNSLKNNYNEAKIHRHQDYIDNKINEYLQQLDEEEDPSKIEDGSCHEIALIVLLTSHKR